MSSIDLFTHLDQQPASGVPIDPNTNADVGSYCRAPARRSRWTALLCCPALWERSAWAELYVAVE